MYVRCRTGNRVDKSVGWLCTGLTAVFNGSEFESSPVYFVQSVDVIVGDLLPDFWIDFN